MYSKLGSLKIFLKLFNIKLSDYELNFFYATPVCYCSNNYFNLFLLFMVNTFCFIQA